MATNHINSTTIVQINNAMPHTVLWMTDRVIVSLIQSALELHARKSTVMHGNDSYRAGIVDVAALLVRWKTKFHSIEYEVI